MRGPLVGARLGAYPWTWGRLVWRGVGFEVTDVDRRRVRRVRMAGARRDRCPDGEQAAPDRRREEHPATRRPRIGAPAAPSGHGRPSSPSRSVRAAADRGVGHDEDLRFHLACVPGPGSAAADVAIIEPYQRGKSTPLNQSRREKIAIVADVPRRRSTRITGVLTASEGGRSSSSTRPASTGPLPHEPRRWSETATEGL